MRTRTISSASETSKLRRVHPLAISAWPKWPRIAPPSLNALSIYCEQGRAWVQADEDDTPVGYLIADVVDGAIHIEQVSIDPPYAGRRLGLGLIDHVGEWARTLGFRALTLTTFTEVPWNGPFYERCGFAILAESDLTPGLRRIRADEAEHGLDRWPRACMRRELG